MTIVRNKPAVSRLAGVPMLQRAGVAVVRRALAALRFGSIELLGPGVQVIARFSAVTSATGSSISATGPEPGPSVRVRVHDPAFFAAVAFGGSCGAGEAYIDSLYDTDDLPGLIELIAINQQALAAVDSGLARLLGPLERLRYRLERNSRRGAQRNIGAHYDLSNEFFSCFLDESMTYSSGVFDRPGMSLHEAQLEKIDRACRKLDLGPADHLLEIGTGWGALAIHAASRYGCRVTTTTISREQHALATARVREAGLSGRVQVVLRDYRDLTGTFDKLVSIEMIEAVGREHFDTFFRACSQRLAPNGLMLLQAITIRDHLFEAAARRRDFLKKHVFPGSCLTSHASMLDSVSRVTDLAPLHTEDLGPHYCTTLASWRASTLSAKDRILALGFDERFCRHWEFYLAYSEGVFRSRKCSVAQLLFAKPAARCEPYVERGSSPAILAPRDHAQPASPAAPALPTKRTEPIGATP